jgi:S-adenosylmethionine-diacylglycerol 3-amino-3-carboxypropyl transferase
MTATLDQEPVSGNKLAHAMRVTRNLRSEVADRPFFRSIGYSNCWEDPAVLQEALQVGPGDRCFSVTSGGCNTLSLLLHDPAKVVALDFNASQNHLLRLKIAAFQKLEHGELLELLGIRRSTRRQALYQKLRPALIPEAKGFWDEHGVLLDSGVMYVGRLERYLLAFGKLMRAMYGRKRLRRFFDCATLQEQRAFYDKEIDGPLWRMLFDLFFSRTVMTRAKDKEHFRLVNFKNFGRIFRERAEHAFTGIPARSNYFLALILLGHYLDEDALPSYLLRENFETMRSRVDRVEPVTGEIEQYFTHAPDGAFTRFNLSNLFDWISEPIFVRLHLEIVRLGGPGARMANWNTLLARSIPDQAVPRLKRFPEEAASLLKRDRAFLYANFEVGQVQ